MARFAGSERRKIVIITTGFSKGGTSKTTLSVELALAALYHGHRCILIDADRQRSASNFSALRERRRTTPGLLQKKTRRGLRSFRVRRGGRWKRRSLPWAGRTIWSSSTRRASSRKT